MTIEKMFRLDGKVALVTGASSGLGEHFARTLSRAGARVAVAARREDRLQALVTEIRNEGGKADAFSLDVSNASSIAACLDGVVDTCGAISVLINNAGTAISKPLLQQTEADYDAVVDVNLKGAWLVAQETARRMADSFVAGKGGGSIVNIASILGERQGRNAAPYAISKAGLIQATKILALELARKGVRCNAILPGYVITDMNRDQLKGEGGDLLLKRIPSQRFGSPQDLDGALLLLASEASAHITGATLAVDGGHLVSGL
jgi:NAD(P)-dependent dehydrogenase (short-subunit alcohol dehydrogenase family)